MASTSENPVSSIRPTSGARRSSSRHSNSKKPWDHHRRPSFRSEKQVDEAEERRQLSKQVSRQSSRRQPRWWKIRFFKGMIDDVKRRAPFYWSDWTDAWDYRVIPATTYMYFAKYVRRMNQTNEFAELSISTMNS